MFMITKRDLLRSAALAAITVAAAKAVPASAQANAEWPDIREAKAAGGHAGWLNTQNDRRHQLDD